MLGRLLEILVCRRFGRIFCPSLGSPNLCCQCCHTAYNDHQTCFRILGFRKEVTPRSLILACPCPEEDVSKRGIIEVRRVPRYRRWRYCWNGIQWYCYKQIVTIFGLYFGSHYSFDLAQVNEKENDRVTSFLEKPSPSETNSRLQGWTKDSH